MVNLHDILDVALLKQHVQNGLVSERPHNDLPYYIYNYTPECQYARAWDGVTTKCRGLIVDNSGNVLARPFPKFFNWDETRQPIPVGNAIRMDKMDGSLGILYPVYEWRFNGGNQGFFVTEHRIATRGSFHSEQAAFATNHFQDMYDFSWFSPMDDKTYLFEIIYPENRIVVDYGDYKGLVLIDVIDNETGKSDSQEFDDCKWPDKVSRKLVNGFHEQDVVDIAKGNEGFVYLWPERNHRVKMKSAEYVELHRIVTNLSEKTVWEAMVAGKGIDEIKKPLPEEFHEWVDNVYTGIRESAYAKMAEVRVEYHEIAIHKSTKNWTRKDFALAVKDSPNAKYLFMILDGRIQAVYDKILLSLKPRKEANE